MAKAQNHPEHGPDRPGGLIHPHRSTRRLLRSSLGLVPLAMLLAAWVLNRVRWAIQWQGVMDMLGVQNRQQFSMLATLIVTCTAILLIKRIIHRR